MYSQSQPLYVPKALYPSPAVCSSPSPVIFFSKPRHPVPLLRASADPFLISLAPLLCIHVQHLPDRSEATYSILCVESSSNAQYFEDTDIVGQRVVNSGEGVFCGLVNLQLERYNLQGLGERGNREESSGD